MQEDTLLCGKHNGCFEGQVRLWYLMGTNERWATTVLGAVHFSLSGATTRRKIAESFVAGFLLSLNGVRASHIVLLISRVLLDSYCINSGYESQVTRRIFGGKSLKMLQ